jgi:hypothetical protein
MPAAAGLIFALPPAELAAHPAEEGGQHELYLMCDDVNTTMAELKAKGVDVAQPIRDEGFGLVTAIRLPSGGELGLYQPRPPRPCPLTCPSEAGARARPRTTPQQHLGRRPVVIE